MNQLYKSVIFNVVAVMAISSVFVPRLNAQSQESLMAHESELAAASSVPFVKDNLATFRTFNLANGIPVIVKLNSANRIYNLRLVLRGGTALTTKAQAGIENVMLQTMARGSTNYPYEKLMDIMDATSSGMGAEVNFDAASYSLNTLDKYFDKIFPVWADTLTNPGFTESDFKQVRENALKALEGADQDPWAKLAREVNQVFFADHPYGAPFDGTKESIDAMTRDSVQAWYSSHFSANRMLIIAVGDFDVAKLEADLNATLGKVTDLKLVLPKVGPIVSGQANAAPGGLIKVDYPASQGLAYMRGDFPAPGPASPDYMSAQIGFKMYTDLLFEVVRTRHSAAYSPGAYIRANSANYGSITLFKTKEPGTIKNYVDDALKPILEGKCLATGANAPAGPHGGSAPVEAAKAPLKLESIADALPIYQAQFINDLYESQQTNGGVAAAIQSSVLNFNDYRYYLLAMSRINAVNAVDIQRVMTALLTTQKLTWGVIGSADLLATVDPAKFK